MLFNILLLVAVIIAALLIIAAFRPSEFRIMRSITMAAPPSAVFARVNDFRQWLPWSPWEKMDPALQRDYSGSSDGIGAIYDWNGNREVGMGRMTIIESRPVALIRIKLEFIKPMPGLATAEFSFRPEGHTTAVTWSMHSTNSNFLCKLMGMFMNMDKMVGTQFEKGLSDLKAVTEGTARI